MVPMYQEKLDAFFPYATVGGKIQNIPDFTILE